MKIIAYPFTSIYESTIGKLVIKATATHIHEVYFTEETGIIRYVENDLTKEVKSWLSEYFKGNFIQTSFPIALNGTDFQLQVWEKVMEIPPGNTASYSEIATLLGADNLSRAVGKANGENKLAIIIPCHRVIATTGALTGYRWGLKKKAWLIDFEAQITGKKLSLFI